MAATSASRAGRGPVTRTTAESAGECGKALLRMVSACRLFADAGKYAAWPALMTLPSFDAVAITAIVTTIQARITGMGRVAESVPRRRNMRRHLQADYSTRVPRPDGAG